MVGFNRKKTKKILIYKGSIHLNDRMAVNFNVISIRFFKTKKSLAQYFNCILTKVCPKMIYACMYFPEFRITAVKLHFATGNRLRGEFSLNKRTLNLKIEFLHQ